MQGGVYMGGGQPQLYGQPQPMIHSGPEVLPKKEQRRREKAKFYEQQERQVVDDSKGAVQWLCGLSVLWGLLLILAMCGSGWMNRKFVGAGAKMVSLTSSLFMIDIDIECGKNFLEDYLCSMAVKMQGRHSLHQAQALACGTPGFTSSCQVMERLYTASFLIFVPFSISLICLLVGTVFLYHYWFSQHHPKLRNFAQGCYITAPLVSIFGMVTWCMYTPDLQDLPRSWSGMSQGLVGSNLLGFTAVSMFQYGWCWVLAAVTLFLQVVTLLIWPCFLGNHPLEEEAILEEELEQEQLEEAKCGIGAHYGATPQAASAPPQPHGQQPPGCGQGPPQQWGQQPGWTPTPAPYPACSGGW